MDSFVIKMKSLINQTRRLLKKLTKHDYFNKTFDKTVLITLSNL